MATHGKNTVVLMDGFNMSNVLDKIETPATADILDITTFNDKENKYKVGLQSATLKASGFFANTTGIEQLLSESISSSIKNLWTWFPRGLASGDAGYGLETIETLYTVTSPVDGTVDIDIEGQANPGRESVTALRRINHPLFGLPSTGACPAVDNAIATTNGGAAYFHKVNNTTRGIAPFIEHSSDNITFSTLVTFSSGTNHYADRRVFSGEVKRYARLAWFLSTGATSSADFTASIARN